MPFDGAGVFYPPNPPVYPAVTGQTIKASYFNQVIDDLVDGLTNCVTKDNQSNVAALTMANLTVTAGAALPAGTTVGGSQALTRRYTTGEIVLSVSSTPPIGTLALNGQTIGSALSGATARANSDTQALFELLWAAADNTILPIQDASGGVASRGASAASDFAANKRLPLPSMQDGDALLAGVSTGVLQRTAGVLLAHTHGLTMDPVPDHNHALWGDINGGNGGAGRAPSVGQSGLESWIGTEPAGGHTPSGTIASTGSTKNSAAGLFVKFYVAL